MFERIDELRAAYSRFLAEDRILLSGHSHQAWPDVAREAQLEPFDEAARLVDDKWGDIFALQAEVGRAILPRMSLPLDDDIAFGESTHQLVFRLLSSLPRDAKVVATRGEFHSLYRQLSRLSEEGLRVEWVARSAASVIDAIDTSTHLVAVSAVMFEDAYVLEDLAKIIARAKEAGALVLVDAYHSFNCVPIDLGADLSHVYVCSGGYKYAGFGNGLCWLRIPKDCTLRPVYTGWFADFASLSEPRDTKRKVAYGPGGMRFGGATFDASSLYRARAVLAHWERFGLDLPALRALYTAQTRRIIERLDGRVPLVSSQDDARRGGFVTVRHPYAGAAVSELRKRGVWTDARGELLRIGPAPYTTADEIDRGVDTIATVCSELA